MGGCVAKETDGEKRELTGTRFDSELLEQEAVFHLTRSVYHGS